MNTVMHVLNSNSYSGAENVVITIIKSMKSGYNCEFIYVSPDGPIRELLLKNDINFVPIQKLTVREIRKVAKKFQPTVVHAHDPRASIICAFSCLRVKLISHLHNNSPWAKTFCLNSFAYLLSSVAFDKILAVSDSIMHEYVFGKFIAKKCTTVYNPISIPFILDKLNVAEAVHKQYAVVFLGRISEQKDPIRFINIIRKVAETANNISVAMIGNGEMAVECEKRIKENNLCNNIKMLGFMENPYRILSKARCLCLTSKWEGYGLVVIEALSLGVPVVATSVGGVPAILNDDCGKLCGGDADFVDEITKLLHNDDYRQQKSEAAVARSQALENIDEYVKTLFKLYSD